jgi:molecular chaperone DnaK (HSP70)
VGRHITQRACWHLSGVKKVGRRLIGDTPKNQATMNASNTVFDTKRLIGRKFANPEVQSDMKHWHSKVVPGAGGTRITKVEYKGYVPEPEIIEASTYCMQACEEDSV